MIRNRLYRLFFIPVITVITLCSHAIAAESFTSFVYFTGVGCPHCANTDPVLFKQKVRQGNLLIVEYEIYQDSANAPLMLAYDKQFNSGLGVPMIIATGETDSSIVGDDLILENLDKLISKHKGNGVVLPAGSFEFDKLNLFDLPRKPKIWFKNRVAARNDEGSKESEAIKEFILNGAEPKGCAPTTKNEIPISGEKIKFSKACEFGGWILLQD